MNKNAAQELAMRGMFIGDDNECFECAAELSLKCNFLMRDREIKKAVVDGEEIFYVSNPGLGLWTYEGRFGD
jgi:hypothetical protein